MKNKKKQPFRGKSGGRSGGRDRDGERGSSTGGENKFRERKPRPEGRQDKPWGDKPKFTGKKPWSKEKSWGDKPRYEGKKKSWEDRPDSGERKPWSKDRPRKDTPRPDGRPWERKPRSERASERSAERSSEKPFEKKFEKKFERKYSGDPRSEKRHAERRAAANPNLLYGFHAVEAAWLNPKRVIKNLWLADNAVQGFESVRAIARKKGLERPEPRIGDRNQLDRLLSANAVHQGIVAEVEPLEDVFLSDLLIAAQNTPKMTIVMLDQVTDPHNIGAVLRSCAAFGACAIILQKRHAPEVTGVLAKTASGAVEHVDILRETNLSRALEELKENGFTCIGLDERGETTIAQTRKSQKTVLVMGAEGEGLRHLVGETCDHLARLPTQGPIASLNVSNAAAVALYELTRG